jgi:hypothetical protein
LPIEIIIIILTANEFLPGGSGSTIRHNTQITHTTQNNTPRSNETQRTKLPVLASQVKIKGYFDKIVTP